MSCIITVLKKKTPLEKAKEMITWKIWRGKKKEKGNKTNKKEKKKKKKQPTASHPSVKGQRPQERWIGAHWESQEANPLPSYRPFASVRITGYRCHRKIGTPGNLAPQPIFPRKSSTPPGKLEPPSGCDICPPKILGYLAPPS